MGSLISNAPCMLSTAGDEVSYKINPGVLEVTLANSISSRSVSSDECKRQKFWQNHVDCSTLNEDSDTPVYSEGNINIIRSSSDSETITWCSSSNVSDDSFDFDNLCSFDGLNKRATSRHAIGLEILKAQIDLGADPKVLSTHGDRTCLMFSAMANDLSFTKQLVELGVDVNETNHLGETALSLALELKRGEIAKYLRAQGATNALSCTKIVNLKGF